LIGVVGFVGVAVVSEELTWVCEVVCVIGVELGERLWLFVGKFGFDGYSNGVYCGGELVGDLFDLFG